MLTAGSRKMRLKLKFLLSCPSSLFSQKLGKLENKSLIVEQLMAAGHQSCLVCFFVCWFSETILSCFLHILYVNGMKLNSDLELNAVALHGGS